eukprot:GEZU01008168.1.p1 GENE.GEZU01008168.1~~GEZU01008168.1.p1  ORF type:complete len:194 (-),score=18.22 GEZU01008168.1:73-573(-)
MWNKLIPLGTQYFDARLIISQIVIMQCSHYITWGVLLFFLDLIFGFSMSLDQFFSYKTTSVYSVEGWIVITSSLANAILGAGILYVVIQRAKKCLDFSATVYVLHFFVCTFYKGFPIRWEWWLTNIISAAIMALLGEYICMRRELREIPIKNSALNGGSTSSQAEV